MTHRTICLCECKMYIMYSKRYRERIYRDGILGHQFNKRLESFAPCYSKSLLLADLKNPYKKIRETRKLESIHE
jgi:hypothetical protein